MADQRYVHGDDTSQTVRKYIASADLTDHAADSDRTPLGELERRMRNALDVFGMISTVAITASHDDSAEATLERIATQALAAEVELDGWLALNADAIAHFRAVGLARLHLEDATELGDHAAVVAALNQLHTLYGGAR